MDSIRSTIASLFAQQFLPKVTGRISTLFPVNLSAVDGVLNEPVDLHWKASGTEIHLADVADVWTMNLLYLILVAEPLWQPTPRFLASGHGRCSC